MMTGFCQSQFRLGGSKLDVTGNAPCQLPELIVLQD